MRIRLAPELKDKIEAVAKANGRSMNAEIVQRLEQSFSAEAGVSIGKGTNKTVLIMRAIEELNRKVDDLGRSGQEKRGGR